MGVVKKGMAANRSKDKDETGPAAKGTAQNARRKPLNRPATRKIVRWNDDLDRKLLLSIQSACNTNNIKLPWDKIAELMGNNISEGAIVQHLAKTRIRAVEAGLDVPPPLRRGGTTSGSKAAKTQAKPKAITDSEPKIKKEPRSDLESDNDSDGDYNENESSSKKKPTQKRKPRVEYGTESEDEEPVNKGAPNDDRSPEYVAAGAPFLELPYDNSNSSANTGSNTMATTSPLASDSTMALSSRRESNSSERKVVKFCVSGEDLKQATVGDGMDRMPVLKVESPQIGILLENSYGNGNPMGTSATPTTEAIPAWEGNYQVHLPTLDAMHLDSRWSNDNAMNVPVNGYSMSSHASQNPHSASQFQYPYTSMETTTAPSSATDAGVYQGIMETTHSMGMNGFGYFQASSSLNNTLVPDSFSEFVNEEVSFEDAFFNPSI